MENEFLKIWFSGFDASLDALSEVERQKLFAPCAKACADSFPLGAFRRAKEHSDSLENFGKNVAEEMQGITVEVLSDGSLLISFKGCYCDLYTSGMVKNPKLCECSRMNFLYIMNELFPEHQADVHLLETVIGGDEICSLRVRFGKPIFLEEKAL